MTTEGSLHNMGIDPNLGRKPLISGTLCDMFKDIDFRQKPEMFRVLGF